MGSGEQVNEYASCLRFSGASQFAIEPNQINFFTLGADVGLNHISPSSMRFPGEPCRPFLAKRFTFLAVVSARFGRSNNEIRGRLDGAPTCRNGVLIDFQAPDQADLWHGNKGERFGRNGEATGFLLGLGFIRR
jgi:hypothetical protein